MVIKINSNDMLCDQFGTATPTRTGLFEVQIVGGPLVWSKKESGRFPTDQKDLEKIFGEIEQALNK